MTTTTTKWSPKLTSLVNVGQPTSYPEVWAKLVTLDKITQLKCTFTKAVVNEMLRAATPGYRYRLIDVKDQILQAGQCPCNGLWHADSSLNGEHEYENQLYVSGAAALTEFADETIVTGLAKSGYELDVFVRQRLKRTRRIESGVITKYDQLSLHRGVKAVKAERRLLIRLVSTNQPPVQTKIIQGQQWESLSR